MPVIINYGTGSPGSGLPIPRQYSFASLIKTLPIPANGIYGPFKCSGIFQNPTYFFFVPNPLSIPRRPDGSFYVQWFVPGVNYPRQEWREAPNVKIFFVRCTELTEVPDGPLYNFSLQFGPVLKFFSLRCVHSDALELYGSIDVKLQEFSLSTFETLDKIGLSQLLDPFPVTKTPRATITKLTS